MSGSNTTFFRGENPLRADKLNTAFGERVARTGDTMTGSLTLWRDPVYELEAAPKRYVNALINGLPLIDTTHALLDDFAGAELGVGGTQYLPLTGGTLSGPMTGTAIDATTLTAHGNVLATNTIASGMAQGAIVDAFQNAAMGGVVMSGSNAWAAGFTVNNTGLMEWGDVASTTRTNTRMSLSVDSVLTVNGSISTPTLNSTYNTNVGADLHVTGHSYVNALDVAGTTLAAEVAATMHSVRGYSGFYLSGNPPNGRLLNFETNTYIQKDPNSANLVIGVGNGGSLNIYTGGFSTTFDTSGNVTFPNDTSAAGVAKGRKLLSVASGATNAFVGAYQTDASSCVGFWNNNNTVYWGNADGGGVANPSSTRMYLSPNNDLTVYGKVVGVGAVWAGASGVYYTGLFNGADHGIAFAWTGGQLEAYIDKTRLGAVAINYSDRDEIAELQATVAALVERVAALEAAQ